MASQLTGFLRSTSLQFQLVSSLKLSSSGRSWTALVTVTFMATGQRISSSLLPNVFWEIPSSVVCLVVNITTWSSENFSFSKVEAYLKSQRRVHNPKVRVPAFQLR